MTASISLASVASSWSRAFSDIMAASASPGSAASALRSASKLELRVMTSGGGATMTAIHDHDPKTDRFVLRVPKAKKRQKR